MKSASVPTRSVLLPAALIAGAGLALGAAAVAIARRARAAEHRHPPTGRFVHIKGVRLHYLEGGILDAPTVLLLHGNGAMAEDFVLSCLYSRLAERHRVIAVDRPGFGFSDRPRSQIWTPAAQADLLAAMLRKLNVKEAIVLGHSWGALVAFALGLRHPRQVAGIVLASGYYFPSFRPELAVMAVPAIPGLGDVARYTISPPLARAIAPKAIRRIFAPQRVPRRFSEGFPLDLTLRPSQLRASAAESGLMVPAAAMLQAQYAEIAVPATIIGGTADRIVDFDAQSVRLHDTLPRSRIVELPGLGHMVHYFAQSELTEAVERLSHGRGQIVGHVAGATFPTDPARSPGSELAAMSRTEESPVPVSADSP